MNLVTLGRRRLCTMGALVLVACSGPPAAQAHGIHLFANAHPHRAHAAPSKHRRNSTGKRKRGRRGPRGRTGPAGPIGPQGPTGAVGPQGPGAFKFGYYGAPTANDPVHAVLPVGPFQLGVSCLPGEKTGDVGFKVELTVPAAFDYTQTLETLSSGTQAAPELTEGEEAATPPTPEIENVASTKAVETWASLVITNPATGATTWLELWYGAKTATKSTSKAVCYMSGIEV